MIHLAMKKATNQPNKQTNEKTQTAPFSQEYMALPGKLIFGFDFKTLDFVFQNT